MSAWRQLIRGLSVLARRADADRDIADEVEHYFEEAAAELEANGLTPEEARRRARRDLGSAARVREEVRAFGWENAVAVGFADLRYAARRLRQSPGFTAVGALTLALGIGASTAIFSAVNPILFAPLPYPHPERVTMVWESQGSGSRQYPSFGTYYGLSERSRSFEALAVVKPWQPTMIGGNQPERFEGQRVTPAYFRALGMPPALGRDFRASDDLPDGPRVVILSDVLWRARFAGDRAIVGRPITLDGDSYTVIGVMPAAFENVLAPSARLWAPLQYRPSLPSDGREWGHHLRMVGRLKPGVGREGAASELAVILPTLGRLHPKGYESSGGPPKTFLLTSLQSDLTRDVKPALLAILGAVILLVAIACVNVTNLLLARGAQRRGEVALRLALGAGRHRLIRQFLTESLLLALIGGTLGVAVAAVGVRALVALSPPELPRAGAIGLDLGVLGFAVGITAAIGLAVGLIPALQASRGDPQAQLSQSSRRSAGGHQQARRTLVVSEVALALVLLVSAGLLWRSLNRLFAVAPGFQPSHVLTMQVQLSGHAFDDTSAAPRFFSRALEEVRRVPGVEAAAFTSQLPLSGDYDVYGAQFEKDGGAPREAAFRYAVSPGYCEALGIPLRRGRLLDARDDLPGAPPAALISESFAKKEFGARDPIGQRFHIGADVGAWNTVIGVVGDVKQQSLAINDGNAMYVTPTHWPWPDLAMSLVVRGRDAPALAAPLREAIWSVDRNQPVVRVATLEELLARSAAQRRFALVLFEAFALTALALAAIGIYGVLSGSVTERMREIGVRAALGASRASLLALITRQGMALAGLGVAIGIAGAVIASQAIATLLFGVSRLDPATYLGVIAALLSVAGVACAIPAWHAARVDPAITLRAE